MPRPAEKRAGLPYVYATWAAKLLGGLQCTWSVWFRARWKHEKFEESKADLVKWNRDHTALMAKRQRELEADGWRCYVEDENSFRLQGQVATLAGKPDLVAVKGDRVLVVDGKTGRERDSDLWQVLIYLYALPKVRKDLAGKAIEGEVFYRNTALTLTPEDLAGERLTAITDLMKVLGSDTPPPKRPSRAECRMCTIGIWDCPERVNESKAIAVEEF